MTALTFTKAVKYQEKLRLALDGTAGSGKTWTALLVACHIAKLSGGRVALIDSERSSARKYANDFDFDHLTLPDWSPHTYMAAVRTASEARYAVCVIDSFSHAWEGVLELKDNATARSKSKNSYTEGWREATPVHNQLVDTVLRAPMHIIATLRTKTEYVIEDGKPSKVGMKPIQRDGVDFEFDVVGDMTPENSMVISKTRCSALAGQVIRKPDTRFADALWEWLNDGEEMLGLADVEGIKDALNVAGQAARRAWLDQFGMKPDDLPAARRDEALAFINDLPTEPDHPQEMGAGPADEPVAEPSGNPDGHQDEPATTGPAPADRAIGVRDVAIRADEVFGPIADLAPKGRKTKEQNALRHALVFELTDGKSVSLKALNPGQLHLVMGWLDEIDAHRIALDVDHDPGEGFEITWADQSTSTFKWSELAAIEKQAKEAEVPA